MKLFLMFILMLSSCNSKQVQEGIKGKWFLCKIEYDGEITIQNVCPEVEFAEDGKGKITKPSKDEISFTYTLLSESKTIIISIDANQQYFNEKEYSYKMTTENSIKILELSSNDGTYKYILSREN